jgi:hypothetical protein
VVSVDPLPHVGRAAVRLGMTVGDIREQLIRLVPLKVRHLTFCSRRTHSRHSGFRDLIDVEDDHKAEPNELK